MTIRTLALPLIATFAVSAPAIAQDLGGSEVYGGPIGGYDHVVYSGAPISGREDGVLYGALIGAQAAVADAVVLGVEGEASGSSIRVNRSAAIAVGDNLHAAVGRDFYIGARAGVRAAPNVLVYIKGGYTNMRAHVDYTARGAAAPTSIRDDPGGYRIGAGVAVGWQKVRFLGEYRYSNYRDFRFNGADTGVKARRHQVVVSALLAF